MSRLSHRLFGGPDPLTYLNNVKASFRNADLSNFHIFLSEVDAWIREQNSDLDFERLGRITNLLQFKPHLLQGFNTLLRPNHRLEFSKTVIQVRYCVVMTPKGAKIISPARLQVPFPASDVELRSLVLLKTWWGLLGASEEEDWLVCIAALLQFILDDPATDVICYGRAYNCLRQMANKSILAPSVLINNLKLEPGRPVHGEAFADIYQGSVPGASLRFRVLHMFNRKIEKSDNLYKIICSQVITWRQLNHPNIIPFIGVNTKLFWPRFCFISFWASNGDLMSYLKRYPEHDRFNSICEIVEGIDYLHSLDPPIAHKDIKGANVHLNDRLICCLADFGLSAIVESKPFHRQSPAFQQSVFWTAPEVMNPARYQEQDPQAGDIYSLACTIYEVYTGSPPLFDMYQLSTTTLLAVLLGERAKLPPPGTWAEEEEEMWWLVGRCWADKPQDRPHINLIKHALHDIRVPKLTTACLPDTSIDDTRDFDSVKTWLMNEARVFGMILSNYLQNLQVPQFYNVFKLDNGPGFSNGHDDDNLHPAARERLFGRPYQTATFPKLISKIQAAETSLFSNSPPATPSSGSQRSNSPFHTTSLTLQMDSPPISPRLIDRTHVVTLSGGPAAQLYVPFGAVKVSSSPWSAMRATAPPFVPNDQNNFQFQQGGNCEAAPLYGIIKPLVDTPVDTGALRGFLVHKLALYSQVRQEGGTSL